MIFPVISLVALLLVIFVPGTFNNVWELFYSEAYKVWLNNPWLGHNTTNLFNNNKINIFDIEKEYFEQCPIAKKLYPRDDFISSEEHFKSDEFRNYSLNVFSNSLKIATESFDDLGSIEEDDRWKIFGEFHEYLHESFPKVYSTAELHKINTYGLVYILRGSNSTLKPLMLTAHQDVVPVPEETVKDWKYPPYSAHFDGEFIWSRGSADCKDTLIGSLEALEFLLDQGFQPKRTVVLAFGFDEEISGHQGAAKIAPFLEKEFGKNSMIMVIDEGGLAVQKIFGTRFAMPAVSEKGYLDIIIELHTKGGHSSIPPKHTGIGIGSQLVNLIEDYKFSVDFSTKNPVYYQLKCVGEHARKINPKLKDAILNMDTDPAKKQGVISMLSKNAFVRSLFTTTRAVDVFNSGLKVNALPEKVVIKTNFRIAPESSVDEIKSIITDLVEKMSNKFNLGLIAFNKTLIENKGEGYFEITSTSDLNSAPLTITKNNPAWDIFSGTTKRIFEEFSFNNEEEVIVAPSTMSANTDTRYYWGLSDNIVRFTPLRMESVFNLHAIDERVSFDGHIEGVAWYYELIRNFDDFDLE